MCRGLFRFFLLWLALLGEVLPWAAPTQAALTTADFDTTNAVIYRRSDLPAIRAIYGAPHVPTATAENNSANLNRMWDLIQGYYNQYGTQTTNTGRAWPCIWHAIITEDPTSLSLARARIESLYDRGYQFMAVGGWPYAPTSCGGCPPCEVAQSNKEQHDGEGSLLGGVSVFSVAVAAMEPYLAESTEVRYRRIFRYAHSPKGCVSQDGDTNGEWFKSTGNRANFCFAVAGDSTSAGELAELDTQMDFYRNCLECVLALDARGPVDQYDGKRYANLLAMHWMTRTCLEDTYPADGFRDEEDYFADAALAWALRLRPGIGSVSGVRHMWWEPSTGKFNPADKDLAAFLAYAVLNGNTDALSMFYYGLSNGYLVGTNTTEATKCILPAIFLAEAGDPYPISLTSWTSMERETIHDATGWYLYREEWDWGDPTPTGIRAQFWANDTSLGSFGNAGSYNIEYGDKNLAWRGFRRYTDFDHHMFTVAERTWGFNALEIVSSAETWNRGFKSLIKDANSDGDCTDEYADIIPIFGNQDEGDYATIYTDCYNGTLEENPGRRGTSVERTVTSRYMSKTPDFSPTYWEGKHDGVYRWTFFGKPEWLGTNRAFWVVVDQAKPKTGVTELISWFHTPNMLHANGSLTRYAGAGLVNPDSIGVDWDGNPFVGDSGQGGRYRTTNSTAMWSKNDPGQIVIYPLYSEGNSGASEYVEIVGGPSNLGTGAGSWWNKWQYASSTYAGTNTSSYEFFRNWGGTWKNLTPGTSDPAAICEEAVPGTGWYPSKAGSPSEYKVINNSDRTTRLSGDPTVGPGAGSSDYSARMIVESPQVGEWSTIAYGGWVGSATVSSGALPSMQASTSASGIAVVIVDNGKGCGVVRSWPNVGYVRPSTITWTNPNTNNDIDWTLPFLLTSATYAVTRDGNSLGNVVTDADGTLFFADSQGGTTYTATLVTSSTGACCLDDGTCTVTSQGLCTGFYLGDGTSCGSCPPPNGACCLPDGTCFISAEVSCTFFSYDWQGAATVCEPNPCPQPQLTGACCKTDGTCVELSLVDCIEEPDYNTFEGVGTDCSPNPCSPVIATGACCTNNGTTCTDLTLADCTAAGGVFLDDFICADNPCPDTLIKACCLPTGVCILTTQALCTDAEGTWIPAATTCNLSCLAHPYGACCATDGSCTYVLEYTCTEASGEWRGAGVQCDPCIQESYGACCFYTQDTSTSCLGQGGLYLGDGTECVETSCPGLTVGACCMNTGYCSQLTYEDCSYLEGDYQGDGSSCIPDPCPVIYRSGTGNNPRVLGQPKEWSK